MPFDVDLSCGDWFDRIQTGRVPMPDVPVDERVADVAGRCFGKLRIPDMIGQPTIKDAGGDWFAGIVRTAFGCVDPDSVKVDPNTGDVDMNGVARVISEIFLLVPKKNGKTTYSAALGLTALLMNTVPNARMVIVGPTQQIAETCLGQATGMIRADPKLSKMLHVIPNRNRIVHLLTNARLEIRSFDANVVTGGIPVFCIIDELHLLSSKSFAKMVIGQLRGGMIKKNSLLVMITTQAAERPFGVFESELNYARAIRDGKRDANGKLVITYEYPEAMQLADDAPWKDPEYWGLIQPNLGKGDFSLGWLERNHYEAKNKSAEDYQLWLSQHLNIQIGMGLHDDRWVGVDYWQKQARDKLDLLTILDTSDVAVIGIDGGGLDDLLGLAVIGRHAETRVWQLWTRAWANERALERRKSISDRLRDFERLGEMSISQDAQSDVEEAADICAMVAEAGLLPERYAIGLDPEGVADIIDALADRGITGDQLEAVPQGYRLNAAIKGLPRKLKNGTFVHGGQALMEWCVSNAKSEKRGNAELVTKAASGTGKIDPLMATFDAFMLMSRNPVANRPVVLKFDDDYRPFAA